MSYKVLWNNICLLTNMERKYIQTQIETHSYFPFEFEFFGLGQACYLTEKITADLESERIEGDILVSTDIDVFHDAKLSAPLLASCKQKLPITIRPEIAETFIIHPTGFFYPFVVIPLVIVANKDLLGTNKVPQSLEEFLHPDWYKNYAFGGIHNSAGRSLLKSISFLYGDQAAESFAAAAVITTMPAHAFQKVMRKEVAAALVPTIFAQRQGINGLVACWPREGAVAVPSYIAVKTAVNEHDFILFRDSILGPEHQQELKNAGAVIPTHPLIPLPSYVEEYDCRLLYPPWSYISSLDYEKFYALCEKYAL